ncbi:MAG: tetratricopeptide repeat protein [Spirochaetales bacterium]
MDPITVVLLAVVALVLYLRRGLIFLFLANRAFVRKDEAKTLVWFGRTWKIRQLNPGMVASYAYQLLKAGETAQADELLATYEREGLARSRKPLKPADHNLLKTYQSLVLWKQGHLPEALALLQGLHASGYKTASLYGNLGWFLLEAGDLAAAEVVCLEAHAWSPSGKVILDNLASLYLRQDNLEKAQESYEALLALEPKFPEAWYGAAQVALRLENPETAVELLEHALTLPFNSLTTVPREKVEQSLELARSQIA